MNPRQKPRMAGQTGEEDGGFGASVAAAGRAIIADARRTLNDPKLSDPEAVHDLRKALKRWRAYLRLIERPLGAPAEAMRAEAREVMRALAGARDAQSALDALDDLRKSDAPLSATTTESIRTRLTALRDAAEATGFTAETRERIARYLDYAALSLERWPIAAIDFDVIADRLAATYRRARALVPQNWAQCEPEHLHELRRRVVEHRHQMDIVEPLWPRGAKAWAQKAQRLRNRLGACQDLEMLSHFTAPHQPLARWRSRLTPAIAARRVAHLTAGARVAARLFADKPKAFRKRIEGLRKAPKQQVARSRPAR
jgi:CHAD domain-containing protein